MKVNKLPVSVAYTAINANIHLVVAPWFIIAENATSAKTGITTRTLFALQLCSTAHVRSIPVAKKLFKDNNVDTSFLTTVKYRDSSSKSKSSKYILCGPSCIIRQDASPRCLWKEEKERGNEECVTGQTGLPGCFYAAVIIGPRQVHKTLNTWNTREVSF